MLEVGSGHGCTPLWMYLKAVCLKMVKTAHFMLYIFCYNFKVSLKNALVALTDSIQSVRKISEGVLWAFPGKSLAVGLPWLMRWAKS